MKLDVWAWRWGVSSAALLELRQLLGVDLPQPIKPRLDLSEQGVQSIVRLEASRKGCRLWRNNVGATYTKRGDYIRYGLANDSTVVNENIKSADLIGIRPVRVQPWMVGMVIGQFLSREIKHSGWKFTGGDRERAQLAWAELILSLGGDACFANSEGTI